MRHQFLWLGASVVLLIAVWWLFARVPATSSPNGESPFVGFSEPNGEPSLYVGTATCAASACHGSTGSTGASDLFSRREFSHWMGDDKHALTYQVLRSEASANMVRRLGWGERAESQRRCLACHAWAPELVAGAAEEIRREREAYGVGCEACHGPARQWLGPHTSDDWRRRTTAEKTQAGMAVLKPLDERGKSCVGCHVGAPADPQRQLPHREVDHDMIAAGHPRLRFEFAAYQANLPPHWDFAAEHESDRKFEARAYLAGRLVAARAALLLLQDRAQRSDRPRWPEFSEYSCFSCHRDLHLNEPPASGSQPLVDKPGSYRWGDWYFFLFDEFAGAVDDSNPPAERESILEPIDQLRTLMANPHPSPNEVVERAKAAIAPLDTMLAALRRRLDQPHDERIWNELLATIRKRHAARPVLSWDQAAQLRLLVRALGLNTGGSTAELDRALRFPAGYSSPRDFDVKVGIEELFK